MRRLTMDGSAIWRGQKVTIAAKLDNTGALVRAGGKSGLILSLDAKPMSLQLAGSVANAGEGEHSGLLFDGKADLAVPSVRDLVAWSGPADRAAETRLRRAGAERQGACRERRRQVHRRGVLARRHQGQAAR